MDRISVDVQARYMHVYKQWVGVDHTPMLLWSAQLDAHRKMSSAESCVLEEEEEEEEEIDLLALQHTFPECDDKLITWLVAGSYVHKLIVWPLTGQVSGTSEKFARLWLPGWSLLCCQGSGWIFLASQYRRCACTFSAHYLAQGWSCVLDAGVKYLLASPRVLGCVKTCCVVHSTLHASTSK